MNLSRRGFLKVSAAAPAVISTGGASAVPAVAASLAGGAGVEVAAMAAMTRKMNVLSALVRFGGFPSGTIRRALSFSNDHRLGEEFSTLCERVFKTGEVFLTPKEWGRCRGGRINCYSEGRLVDILKELPLDTPILDLLDVDIYNTVHDNGSDVMNFRYSGETEIYRTDNADISAEDIQSFRQAIEPYCTAETTTADLVEKLRHRMINMAQRFIEHPADFAGSYRDGNHTALDLRHCIGELTIDKENTPEEIKELLDTLNERSEKYRKLYEEKDRRSHEKRNKVYTEKREHEHVEYKIKREEKRARLRANPSERERFTVYLYDCNSGVKGEYLAASSDRGAHFYPSAPLHMDWLHFVQEIDPENAKPADVELRAGGLMVAFHNAKVIAVIEEKIAVKQMWKPITIPNRRYGVDLNDYGL